MIKKYLQLAILTGLLGMFVCFLQSCSRSQKDGDNKGKKSSLQSNQIYSKSINGVLHIFNPSKPLKGVISLQLEPLLKIDAMDMGDNDPVTFSRAFKAENGGIFLSDLNGYKIYEFSPTGKLLKSFLGRGDGPAELPFGLFDIQDFGENIWVLGYSKIIKFDKTRKAVWEAKLNTRYKNFEMPDENHFIGNYFKYNDMSSQKAKTRRCICALIDKNETVQVSLLEDEHAGDTQLEKNIDGQIARLNFANPLITPMILHHLTHNRKSIYTCVSNEYAIYKKDLLGKTEMVLHREYQEVLIPANDRETIADGLAARQPPQIKKMIIDNLPTSFSVLLDLQPLPRGYLAVFKIRGLNNFEIDVFNSSGQFVYQFTLPGNMVNELPHFYGNMLSVIRTLDDRDIYEEYKVKGLPDVFDK